MSELPSSGIRAEDITIEHEFVGEQHFLTSPDVPGLYVVHRDESVARGNVQSALDMLERMRRRRSRLPHPLDPSEG